MKRYTSKIKRKRGYTRRNKKKNNFKGSRKKHRRKGTTRKNKKLIFNMRGGAYKFIAGNHDGAKIPEPSVFEENSDKPFFDMLASDGRMQTFISSYTGELLSNKDAYEKMFNFALENKDYKNILPPLSLLNKTDENNLMNTLKNLNFSNKSSMAA